MSDKINIPDGAVLLDPRSIYDDAIIGSTNTRVIYDTDLVAIAGVKIHGTIEDSFEWHDHNTFSAHFGDTTPIFVTTI